MSYLPTTFEFESRAVRSVTLNDAPWFVANDVCAVLDIADARQALDKLDADERGGCSIPTPSGHQEMRTVSESGLYTLILRCRGATTPGTVPHRFRKWVTSEVLPSIRKTGAYAPQADHTDHKLRLVAECRRTFGREAARGLWISLGLPAVIEPGKPAARIARALQAPSLVEKVATRIEAAGTDGIYRRALMRHLSDQGRAAHLDPVIADLVGQRRIATEIHRRAAGGSSSILYRWVSDAERTAPVAASLPH